MNFSDIICKLKKYFKINLISSRDSHDLHFVRLLDGREASFHDDILYFSYDKVNCFPKNCIFIGDVSDDANYESLASISKDDFFAAYNFTEKFLANDAELDCLEDLALFTQKTKDLASFINKAALALNNPLILIDRDFKIAAYSTSLPPKDLFWAKTVVNGYCNYQVIKESEDIIGLMLRDKTRKAHLGEIFNYSSTPSIYSNVFKNGKLWGVVMMLAEKTNITYEHYNYLPNISKFFEEVINRFDISGSKDMTQSNSLLHKILVGASIDDLDISSLNLKHDSKYLIVTVQTVFDKEITIKVIESICGFTHVLAFSMLRDRAVFLMSLDSDGTYFDRKSDLIKISQDENLRVGISNTFDSLDFVSKAYAQSVFAINFPSGNVLKFYSNYYFADLLKNLVDAGSGSVLWDEYIHPCLTILMDYDEENNTDLYNTLKVYLENNSKIKETSAALFLHRNSVKYRLDKIVELCRINLENSETIFLLQLSFHIITYKDLGFF